MTLFTLHSYLFILLSLCTLIRSDSALSYFQPIDTRTITDYYLLPGRDDYRQVHRLRVYDRVRNPRESLFDGSIESCAKQCHSMKFFCRFFAVVLVREDAELRCVMDYYRPDKYMADYVFDPDRIAIESPTEFEVAYEYVSHIGAQGLSSRIKDKIDNVATISQDPTILTERRFDELLRGYGIYKSSLSRVKWEDLEALLETCTTALTNPMSTSTNFKDWLSGKKSSPFEHFNPYLASRYTLSGKPARKRTRHHTITTTSHINLLSFFDQFSRAVDRHTQTIYNPEEGILYIHSPKFELLLIVHSDGDYIWASARKEVSQPIPIEIVYSREGALKDSESSVVDILKKAAAHFGSELTTGDVHHQEVFYDSGDNKPLIPLLGYLLSGSVSTFYYEHYSLLLLLHDLSQVVPIIVRNQLSTSFSLLPV